MSDEGAVPANAPAKIHYVLRGTIKSISRADPVKGSKSEIVLKDTKGKIYHILLLSNTTLWDADSQGIMPDKLLPKKRVKVIYMTTVEGINVAKSIKILK